MANSSESTELRALLMLAFGAVCISFAAIFVKLLDLRGMGPTAIAFWRVVLGAVILFGWAVAARINVILPWSILRWTILAGFLFFLDLFFWHRSIIYSGAGMSTILANTQVFGTAVLSFFIFKERLTLKFFVAAVSAVVGVVLLIGIGSDIAFSSLYLKGIAFGLLTGIVYAHYIIVLKLAGHEERQLGFIVLMAWVSLFSAVFLGFVLLTFSQEAIVPPDWFSLVIAAALALIAQALGWWAISSSLPKIDASRSGLLLVLQPVLTSVWGALFFDEYLTVLQIFGAVITLVAIYVGSIRRKAVA